MKMNGGAGIQLHELFTYELYGGDLSVSRQTRSTRGERATLPTGRFARCCTFIFIIIIIIIRDPGPVQKAK
jgi:hypothetical protein